MFVSHGVTVHPLSANPTAAWKEISKTQSFYQLTNLPLPDTNFSNVRIVCMSDTHSEYNYNFNIPNGDIFIHAGDFTRYGRINEILEFNNWLGKLPHLYKIVICGNHELCFDSRREKFNPNARNLLTNCIYLQDSSINLFGLNFYGAPWQPKYRNWAFNLPRGDECLSKWNLIPPNIDVLITHTPPLGHGDLLSLGTRAGCVELLTTVQQRVKPKYHIFGHIHEGYGVSSDGQTIYINAATCDRLYRPRNKPIVFDYNPDVMKLPPAPKPIPVNPFNTFFNY